MAESTAPETPRDWVDWHRKYDDPDSRLVRRLAVVQAHILQTLDAGVGELRIISMCAGQGRDLLPVLADHPRRGNVRALLVELDERNATIARDTVQRAGLDRVDVLCADAALTDNYAGHVPADLILACGIFGNISLDDIRRIVQHLPSLGAAGATVIWTRGRWDGEDVTPEIRRWFGETRFEELAFDAPDGAMYSVGVNRLVAKPSPFERGVTLFKFFR
jgi:hypothetical protein